MLKDRDFNDDDSIFDSSSFALTKYAKLKHFINKVVQINCAANIPTFKYVVGIDVWNKHKQRNYQFHYFVLRHISGEEKLFDSGITISGGLEEFILT
jgi:hypothetical protein